MQAIKQNETTPARKRLAFTAVSSSNVLTRLDASVLTFTTRIIRPDSTSAAGSGAVTQPDASNAAGACFYTPGLTDHTVVGPNILRISATGMEPREVPFLVLGYDPYTDPGARAPGFLAIKKSESTAARRSVPFTAVSSSNLQTRLDASALTFTVRILKADGTSSVGGGTVSQPDATNATGCCFYVGAAADFDAVGETIIRISATGMEPREISVTVVDFDPYAVETIPVIANAATVESIRDRILTLIEGVTPAKLSTKFLRHRAERDGNFVDWAEKNPAAAFRRISASEVGDDEPPETSNVSEERVRTRFEVRIAYPQTHRYGPDNERDRKDLMNADWKAINLLIGVYGRGNFSGSNDCTPLGCTKTTDASGAVDFLVVTFECEYVRAVT